MATEVDEDGAIYLITSGAQLVLSFCLSDRVRQTVCVRCARLFSDYARDFGKRSAVTKPDNPIPKVAVSTIENALKDTERRRPSWMGDAVDVPGSERPTDPAGLVNYEPVLKKDQR